MKTKPDENKDLSRAAFLKKGAILLAGTAVPATLSCGREQIAAPANLVGKGHAEYNSYRRGYNLRIDQYPHAAAPCRNEQDVQRALEYAAAKNLRVSVKSSGHSFEGFSGNSNGLLIDVTAINHQTYTPGKALYRAGPAVRLAQAYDFLFPRRRLIPLGSCATVALGGLTLGGGYGLFSRAYGLSCDNLARARMVDGTGRILDTREDAELLWALRGGGNGNFGIVTSMEFNTVPMPGSLGAWRFKSRKLTARNAVALCREWFTLARKLPHTAFSAFVLNGTTLTVLVTDFAPRGPAAVLKPLREMMDRAYTPTRRPLARAVRSYYGVREPLYFRNCSAGYYRDFQSLEKNIEAIFSRVTAAKGVIFQINTLGGAIDDPVRRAASAYPHRAYPFLGELQSYWRSGPQAPEQKHAFASIQNLLRESGVHRHYRNYPSLAFENPLKSYYGENLARLQGIKKRLDPRNLFSHGQTLRG